MVVGGVTVLVSGFYEFYDELPLILAFFKLSQRVFCLAAAVVTGRL